MANSGLKTGLSAQDVARLLNDRSADVRIETMSKLVAELEGGTLEPSVRVLAVDLLHRFARDAELAVREAVAWQIYNSPLLSEDTAQRLARDIASVAFPILRHADGLDDALLLAIIGENDGDKHLAIAGRSRVSAAVSDALVETAGPEAVSCLLANEGAAITEHAMHKALDRYGAVEQVNRPLAARPGLPLTVVEKLVTYVSEEIRTSLVTRYHIPPGVVRELVTQGREAATVTLVEPIGGGTADLAAFARHLDQHNRLTPSLLFRALCSGEIALFAVGVATRARIEPEDAWALAFNDGAGGLKLLFQKARLTTNLLPPFRTAIRIVKTRGVEAVERDRAAFQTDVLACVFADCAHIQDRQVDDLLLHLFDQKPDEMIEQAMDRAGIPFVPLRPPEGFAPPGAERGGKG